MVLELFKRHPQLVRVIAHLVLRVHVLSVDVFKDLDDFLKGDYFVL